MRRFLFASLLHTTARRGVPMRMAEAPEGGAPETPAAPLEGVVQEGGTTQVLAENTPENRPTEWPEGVNSWEDFGKLSPEARQQALNPAPAAEETSTEITTTNKDETRTGIDLLVDQTLEGVSDEMRPKAEPFVRKFAEAGTLTDEEVTQAAKETGFSEAMVRQFMKGGETMAADAVGPVFEQVGGAANWDGFRSWANEALGPEDHAKINEALGLDAQGNSVKGEVNPEALKEYTAAFLASGRGPAPRDLTTEARTTDPTDTRDNSGFGSIEEQTAAINDPRYRSDPSYRRSVEQKVGRSSF